VFAAKSTTASALETGLTEIALSDGLLKVDNGIYELTFDPKTGMTTSLRNLKSNIETSLEISWGWYNSSVGGCTTEDVTADQCDGQKSGAYIFRPNSSTFFYPGPKTIPTLKVVKGPVVTEVYQVFSEWATHVIRLVQGQPYVEVEWTAGPIPIGTPWMPADSIADKRFDEWGKEVVVKYKSGLQSDGTFFRGCQWPGNGPPQIQQKRAILPRFGGA